MESRAEAEPPGQPDLTKTARTQWSGRFLCTRKYPDLLYPDSQLDPEISSGRPTDCLVEERESFHIFLGFFEFLPPQE